MTHLTTSEAAAALDIKPGAVAKLCRQGAHGPFPGARKQGRDWLIPESEVAAYAASDRKPGPKRKQKPATPLRALPEH